MASNTAPNPTCKECSKLYTDPRMLPCLHSFCKKCIEKLVEKQETKHTLKCPTCNEEATIPPGGVDGIPQDVRARDEAEVKKFELKIKSASDDKCEHCIREGSGDAVAFCVNCCEILCKMCREDHTQFRKTLNHELVGIGEKTEGKEDEFRTVLPQKPIACGQHRDENLKFFCETCETLICRDCAIVDHNDHTYNRLEKVDEKEKSDLRSTMDGVKQAKQKLEDAIGKREKLVQQVEQMKKVVDETITSGFKQLYEALHNREEALLAKSSEIGLGKTSTLAIENEELKRMRDEIDVTCQLITGAVEMYTPNQLLSTKKVMKARLHTLLKKFQEMTLEPTTTAAMPMSLEVSPLLTEVATLGAVACPWMATADIYIPRATVNKERKVKVTARDEAGKPYPHGGEIVKGSFSRLGSSNAPTEGTTTDNGDGTYVVNFTPTTAGEHELRISISRQQIKGSPFIFSVHWERAYQSLTDYQQVYNTAANPWDVAIHDNGDLYVAAYGAHCICVLTSSGTHKLSFGTQGNGQGQFHSPSGIALHGDVVYVTEYSNNRVQKLSIKGEHLAIIGEGQLSNPLGICLDLDGRIFVADYSNSRVQVFNEDGSHAYSITGSSAEGSNLTNPWGIALDSEGQLHVVDYSSMLVRVFTAEGKYITTYGSGQFSYGPAGIAIDDEGYSFVTVWQSAGYAGYARDLCCIFNPQHQLIPPTYCQNYQCSNPAGVAIDKDGFIWVAESSNNRITQL